MRKEGGLSGGHEEIEPTDLMQRGIAARGGWGWKAGGGRRGWRRRRRGNPKLCPWGLEPTTELAGEIGGAEGQATDELRGSRRKEGVSMRTIQGCTG